MKTWPPYTRHERISGIVRSQPIKDAIIPTLCKTVHNFFGNRFKVWKHLLKLSEWLTQKRVKYLPGINLAPWNWHIKMAIPMKKLYIFFEKLKKLNKVKNNIFFARQVSRTKLSNPGPRPREVSWPVRQFIVHETDWLISLNVGVELEDITGNNWVTKEFAKNIIRLSEMREQLIFMVKKGQKN